MNRINTTAMQQGVVEGTGGRVAQEESGRRPVAATVAGSVTVPHQEIYNRKMPLTP